MKNTFIIVFFLLADGCQTPNKGLIDTDSVPPPFISLTAVTPALINVNEVAVSATDVIDTVLQLSATVSNVDQQSRISFTIIDPSGNPIEMGALVDNGIAPDRLAGDGVFSGAANFSIHKEDIGTYTVQFQATNSVGYQSNIILRPLSIQNSNNHRPTISNPVLPDTVFVPSGSDTTFINASVTVSDQDGLEDIASVSFTSRRPDGSVVGVYPMYDDGGVSVEAPFGLRSGDTVAGDGIFALTIPLTSSADKNTYRDFSFVATDRTGESSDVITKRIYLK
ncbi:MAG TPA: choice-of-anchor X domain-containing protein [Bacteroidota bacterium]|nr:choice-of-anchor X domain-containing protein [Bacteroidota bacterium]